MKPEQGSLKPWRIDAVNNSVNARGNALFLPVTLLAGALWAMAATASGQTPSPSREQTAPPAHALTLNDAIQQALANNLSFRSELERIGVAEGQLLQAKALPNPVATASMTTDRFAAHEGEGGKSAGIEQEFETAGKRRYRILTARSDLERIRHETEVVERDLILQTQQVYFTILLNQRDLELARQTSGILERFVTLNRKRVQLGEAPGIELNLAEIELARSRKNELDFERRFHENMAGLNLLVGLPADSATTLAGDFSAPESSLQSDREFLAYGLLHRPDVLAAESNLEARRNASQLARSFRFPNVTLGAGFQQQSSVIGSAGSSGAGISEILRRDRQVAFQATVPLPLFNHNKGNIASADYERRAAEEKAAYLRNVVASQIAAALSNYRSRVLTRALYEKSILPQLQKNLDSIFESYRLGNESIFAVIQVQRTYFETRHEYFETLIDLESDRIALERAAGLPFEQGIRIPAPVLEEKGKGN